MRRKKRKPVRPARASPARARDDLKGAPRGLVGPEDAPRRLRRAPADDASVEDPLGDWPED